MLPRGQGGLQDGQRFDGAGERGEVAEEFGGGVVSGGGDPVSRHEAFQAGDGFERNGGGFRGSGEGNHDAGLAAFGGQDGVETAAVGGQRVGVGGGERAGTAEETGLFAADAEAGGVADGAGEGVGEVAGKFVLPVAGAVQVGAEGVALGIAETFANGDHDAAETLVDALDVVTDLGEGWRTLGEIDEMRGVVGVGAGEGRGADDPAGIPADDFDDGDGRGQGAVVSADVAEGMGIEASGRAEAGAVMGAEEIVVDGLGDADDGDGARLVEERGGPHGSVAASEEDGANSLLPAAGQGGRQVGRLEGLPRGAEDGAGGAANLSEEVRGEGAEIDPVVVQQPMDTVAGSVEAAELARGAACVNDPDEAGVENRGGSSAVDYDRAVAKFAHAHNILCS